MFFFPSKMVWFIEIETHNCKCKAVRALERNEKLKKIAVIICEETIVRSTVTLMMERMITQFIAQTSHSFYSCTWQYRLEIIQFFSHILLLELFKSSNISWQYNFITLVLSMAKFHNNHKCASYQLYRVLQEELFHYLGLESYKLG